MNRVRSRRHGLHPPSLEEDPQEVGWGMNLREAYTLLTKAGQLQGTVGKLYSPTGRPSPFCVTLRLSNAKKHELAVLDFGVSH